MFKGKKQKFRKERATKKERYDKISLEKVDEEKKKKQTWYFEMKGKTKTNKQK